MFRLRHTSVTGFPRCGSHLRLLKASPCRITPTRARAATCQTGIYMVDTSQSTRLASLILAHPKPQRRSRRPRIENPACELVAQGRPSRSISPRTRGLDIRASSPTGRTRLSFPPSPDRPQLSLRPSCARGHEEEQAGLIGQGSSAPS